MTEPRLAVSERSVVPPLTELAQLLDAPGLRAVVAGTSKDPNAKVTVLLIREGDEQPAIVAKVPTTDGAAVAVERERELLGAIEQLDLGPLRPTVPGVIGTVEWRGRRVLLTTGMSGSPMSTTYHRWRHNGSSAAVIADFRAAGDWLETFQERTATALGAGPNESDLSRLLRRRFAAHPGLGEALELLRDLEGSIADADLPPSAVQGDFWFGNLLLANRTVSGVVDWEHGVLVGQPARDWARFAIGYALYLDRHTAAGRPVRGHRGLRAGAWGAGVVHAMEGVGWFPSLFSAFLQRGLTRLGGPPRLWRHVALVGLAEVAAVADHDAFAERHLELFQRLAGRTP